MVFLKRFLSRFVSRDIPPPRYRWPTVSEHISGGLTEVREIIFSGAIKGIKCSEAIGLEKENSLNEHLANSGELGLKAFQLHQASWLIMDRKYIEPKDGQDFADLLWAQVGSSDSPRILKYYDRYLDAQDFPSQWARVIGDIVRYITSCEVSHPALYAWLEPLIPQLILLNHIVVARAFGDYNTAEKFERNYKEFVADKIKNAHNINKQTKFIW